MKCAPNFASPFINNITYVIPNNECNLCPYFSFSAEETYFLVEKAVAERLIFEKHLKTYHHNNASLHNKSREEDNNEFSVTRPTSACPLTMPANYHFLYLPYGLVVAKKALLKDQLIAFMNQRCLKTGFF